ncbi:MAG: hypothetical protein ACI3YT_10310 [Prevotella sp.]
MPFAQFAQFAQRKSKKQKDKPSFPMRIQTLNVTPAMLAERLEEAQGKHSLSFLLMTRSARYMKWLICWD